MKLKRITLIAHNLLSVMETRFALWCLKQELGRLEHLRRGVPLLNDEGLFLATLKLQNDLERFMGSQAESRISTRGFLEPTSQEPSCRQVPFRVVN